jgi:hypothetical protein
VGCFVLLEQGESWLVDHRGCFREWSWQRWRMC